MTIDARIAAVAARQHGIIDGHQLRALGLNANAINRRTDAGRLHRLHRNVYAVGHAGVTQQGRWLAAVRACGPGAALSHRSAAALHGAKVRPGRGIDVVVPTRAGRRRRRGVVVHRSSSLAERDVVVRDGIPVTAAARTLLDLGAVLSRNAHRKAIGDFEGLGMIDAAQLADVLERHPGRRGIVALRGLVVTDEDLRSYLERIIFALCRRHGIAQPSTNVPVSGELVDFFWRDQGVIVEGDSRRHHATTTAFESDRARDAWLHAAGFVVLRFTYRQARYEAATVADRILRVLVRRTPLERAA